MRILRPFLLLALACTGDPDKSSGTDTNSIDPVDSGSESPIDGDGDGFTEEEGDCNDADADINPAQTENYYDGIDSNCDGLSDFDADGDGYDSDAHAGDDCDDGDPNTHPGATEVYDDDRDQDCDGHTDATGAVCAAEFEIEFPDGTVTTIDGCTQWSRTLELAYFEDAPPEVRGLVLHFNATDDEALAC